VWAQFTVNPGFPQDYNIYLNAARSVLRGGSAYFPFEIGASFIYPPAALLLFAPLSALAHSRALWTVVQSLAWLTALGLILRAAPRQPNRLEWLLVFGAAALYAPFIELLSIGQVNALLLLGIALFILGMQGRVPAWAGDLGLALAIAIKMTPALLLVYPLFLGDWKRCARVAGFSLLLAGLSLAAFGAQPWLEFLSVFPRLFKLHPTTINEAITPTLNLAAARIAPGLDLSWFHSVWASLLLGAWLLTAALLRRRLEPGAALNFGLVSLTISSSMIWYHHLVFLAVPALSILFSDARMRGAGPRQHLVLSGLFLINLSRFFEFRLLQAPALAIVGYLCIYLAAGWLVWASRSKRQ